MSDLIVDIANYPGSGRRFSAAQIGTTLTRRRNHLRFKLGKLEVDWYQLPRFHDASTAARRQFDGRFVPTSRLYVRDVNPNHVDKASEAVRDLCWLLRLACLSGVAPYSSKYAGEYQSWSASGCFTEFRWPLDVRDGAIVEDFVQKCWPAYRKLKRRRRLQESIDYLVFANGSDVPVEIKLIAAFTALEHLKTTFARVQRIPRIAGYYRERDALGRASRNSPRLYFEDMIRLMLAEVRMKTAVRRFVPLRNQLIHTGVSRRSARRHFEEYCAVTTDLHRYLFRLLGYSGTMMDRRRLQPRQA
jgi:hypothetical protein